MRIVFGLGAAWCALVIIALSFVFPELLVANWGSGVRRNIGSFEALHGLGIFATGFIVPGLLFALGARSWIPSAIVFALLIVAAFVMNLVRSSDAMAYVIVLMFIFAHGTAFYELINAIRKSKQRAEAGE